MGLEAELVFPAVCYILGCLVDHLEGDSTRASGSPSKTNQIISSIEVFPIFRSSGMSITMGSPLVKAPGAKVRVFQLPGRSDVWNDDHGES